METWPPPGPRSAILPWQRGGEISWSSNNLAPTRIAVRGRRKIVTFLNYNIADVIVVA